MPVLQDIITTIFQLGLSITGASALYGVWFSVGARQEAFWQHEWRSLTATMLVPTFFGVILTSIGWFLAVFFHPFITMAQEGIALSLSTDIKGAIIETQMMFLASMALVAVLGFLFLRMRTKHIWIKFEVYFFALLVLTILTTLVPIIYAGGDIGMYLSTFQLSNIFTLGTLFCIAFLYLRSRHVAQHKKIIHPFFHNMADIFWLGIGFNFFSVLFVLPHASQIDVRFYFVQTLIGCTMIGFATLSGPLLNTLLNAQASIRHRISSGKSMLMTLLGAFVCTSWLAITIVEGMNVRALSLKQMFLAYGVAFCVAMIFAVGVEYFYQKKID